MGLALPFAVVACTSLQTAAGLSIGALMALIPAALILPLVMKQIPQKLQWLDYPLCALLSAVFLMPTRLITGNLSPAPAMSEADRARLLEGWHRAVNACRAF